MTIQGVGYNEFRLGGQPLRDTPDLASTKHPILISNVSRHYSAANSFILNASGISEATPDPAGGAFDRYPTPQRA